MSVGVLSEADVTRGGKARGSRLRQKFAFSDRSGEQNLGRGGKWEVVCSGRGIMREPMSPGLMWIGLPDLPKERRL